MRGVVTLMVLLTAYTTAENEYPNLRPIIAVLAQETSPSTAYIGDSFIRNSYTRFPEAAGAQTLPVRLGQDDKYYKYLFNSTNGLLIPGGGVNIANSTYASVARKFFKMAVEANDRGDVYPIWGSCLGAQMLAAFALDDIHDTYRYTGVDGWNKKWPVNFTKDFRESKMYKDMPQPYVDFAAANPVGQHYHKRGVLTSVYESNDELKDFFHVTSTAVDENGLEFITGMEGKRYPFFYFQFHPEKNLYEWDRKVEVYHHPMSILFAQHLGMVFVNEARKSNHTFPSAEEERKELIFNYQTTHVITPFEMDLYIFPLDDGISDVITKALKSECGSMTVVIILLVITIIIALLSFACCIYVFRHRNVVKDTYNELK